MKSLLKNSLFFLFFMFQFFINEKSFATQININITSSNTIVACKENQFVATYVAHGNHGISIEALLTAGSGSTNTHCDDSLNLFPNVYIIVDSIKNASTTNPITDTSGHNCIWRDSLVAVPNDTVFIYYRLAIDCAALSGVSSNLVLNQIFTNNSIGTDTFRVNNNIPATDTLYKQVLRPYLLNPDPADFTAYYLDTMDITFSYSNTGGGDANISFRFYPDSIDCSGLNTLSLWHADSIGGIFDTLTKGGLTDAFIKAGKTLVIKQRVLVDTCLNGCTNLKAKLIWQCNTLPSENGIFCQGCQQDYETFYSILDGDMPKDTIIRVTPSHSIATWDNSCVNDTANMLNWSFMIINNGVGAQDSLNILLTSRFKDQVLTIVPRASLIVDSSNCFDCTVAVRIDTIAGQQYCTGFVPVPLDTAYLLVRKFRPGDTLIVSFQTFRCIEENDAQLMDIKKFYNEWELQVTGKSICNKTLTVPTGGTLFFPSNGGYFGIGSSFIIDSPKSGDFDMDLDFTPSISHLAVEPGQQFGDVAQFSIELNNISKKPTLSYTQLLGCLGSNCTWNGYLRAKIYCDTGLVMMHPDSDVFFSMFDTASGSPVYIYPDYYNDSMPDTITCSSHNYYYYFSLHDTTTMKMLKNGFFNFKLQACCGGGAEGEATYAVSFYLMPDPDSCISLTYTDTNHVLPPNCSGLGCAWLPMSSVDGGLQILCPGCVAPGIIVDSYVMKRESFGLTDSDNDGKADTSMSVVTPGTIWYNTHEPFLGLHNSSFGDRLVDRMTSRFQPGDKNNGGYDYSQMQTAGGFLNYLQLMRTIPGGTDTLNLQISSFIFYIDTPNAVTPNCINCSAFNVDSTKFRTMRTISVSGAALQQYVDTLAGNYLFTFSSIHNYTSNIDSGTLHSNILFNDSINPFRTFFETQRYRLEVHYDQCGLYDPIVNGPVEDPSTYRRQAKINNRMWLSGRKQTLAGFSSIIEMPRNFYAFDSIGWTFNPNDTLMSLADSTFTGQYLFICEAFGSIHYFYTSLFENVTNITSDTSCIRRILTTGSVYTAGGVYDIYPFEFYPPKIGSTIFKVDVPPGYYIDSAWSQTRVGTPEITNFIFFMPSDTTGTVYIHDSILPIMQCINDNVSFPLAPNDTNAYTADRRNVRALKIICRPFTCSDTTYIFRDTTVIISFDTISPPCLTYTSCGIDTIIYRRSSPEKGGKGIGVLANLKANTITPVKAKAHQVCFPVTITNPKQQIGTNMTTGAYHIFIIVPNATQTPELSNWYFFDGIDTIFPNINGVINIKKLINPDGSISGDLCANYNPCVGTDTVKFYYGWNCNGYPFSKDSSVICGIDSFTRIFVDELVNFQPQGKVPSPFYHLCDTFDVVIPYNSTADGGVQPDSVRLSNLPSNLSLINVYIEKCIPDSTEALTPATSPLTWKIKGSDLDSIGITDSLLSAGECMNIRIRMLANCGYNRERIYSVTLYSHNFCGDTIISITDCDNDYTDEGSYCTDCFTITKTALADTVVIGDTMSYIITVCGDNSSSQSFTLNDLIPFGFDTIGSYTIYWSIPAKGCITDTITGSYHLSGYDSDTNIINTAIITTSSNATFSDTASVTVVETCFDPDYIQIADSTYASTIPTISNGDTIYVWGRWYIDINLTLINCYVIVRMGGHIIVEQGHFLTLDSSTITGCEHMWKGIRVQSQAGITLENGSIIADARHGIYIEENAIYFRIHNSSMIDCVKEIFMEPSVSGSYHYTTCEIYGSTFGYRFGFKTDYPGQPKHGVLAATNIELHDMISVVIGNNDSLPNYFFRSNRGITIVGSDVTITNSEFEGITRDTSYHWDYDGYAIVAREDTVYGKNSWLEVFPIADPNNPPTIHDGFRGVYSRHSDLSVRGLYMKNLVGGTMSEFSNGKIVTIANNKIEASRSGIRWRFNAGAISMWAQQNEIIMSGDTLGTAISMVETPEGLPNYHVLENIIELNDTRFGIRSNAVSTPEIKDNIIKMNRAANPIRKDGIALFGSHYAEVSCNVVVGYDETDTLIRAISVNISEGPTIQCNIVDSSGWGIYFGGINLYTNFRGNEMNNHYHGLHLNNVAVMDTQSFAGNQWLAFYDTTNGSWGAVNMNDSAFFNLRLSLFQIDPIDSTYFPFTPTINPNNSGWFDPQAGGGYFECSSNDCNEPVEDDGGSMELRNFIARDSIITSDFFDQSKSMAQTSLFSGYKNGNIDFSGDTVLLNFVSQKENEPLGKLYEVKKLIKKFYGLDSASLHSIRIADSSLNLIFDSLRYVDSLFRLTSNTSYLAQRVFLVNQASQIVLIKNNIINQHENSLITDISDADEKNSEITAINEPEINEQTINEVEIKYKNGGIEAISEDSATIFTIGSQCPFKGGVAVYKARLFAELFNDSVIFEDDEVCALQGYYRLASNTKLKYSIKVSPNPANEKSEVILEGNYNGICNIVLIDAIGKKQFEHDFDCNKKSYEFDVRKFLPGAYFVKITIGEDVKKYCKLVIVR